MARKQHREDRIMGRNRRMLRTGRITLWVLLLAVLLAAWDGTAQSGVSVAWGTYLGGTGSDYGYDIAVDSSGNVYATGSTASAGWVSDGGDTSYGGGTFDGYVVKLSAAGPQQWSTYLGGTGSDNGKGIAVDSS